MYCRWLMHRTPQTPNLDYVTKTMYICIHTHGVLDSDQMNNRLIGWAVVVCKFLFQSEFGSDISLTLWSLQCLDTKIVTPIIVQSTIQTLKLQTDDDERNSSMILLKSSHHEVSYNCLRFLLCSIDLYARQVHSLKNVETLQQMI